MNKISSSTFPNLRNNIALFIVSLVFIIANTILCFFEFYYLNAVPIVLGVIYLCLFYTEILALVLVFLSPLSIIMEDFAPEANIGMHFPTEPILFGLLIYVLLNSLIHSKPLQSKLIFHPISVTILVYIAWHMISASASSLKVVSIKFIISKLWFIVPFYFVLFNYLSSPKKIKHYFYAYSIGLGVIIIGSTYLLFKNGFSIYAAHSAAHPFFKDHTSYGAATAFCLPLTLALVRYSKYKLLAISLFIVCLAGLVLSFSRAAWVSIVAAFGLFLIIKLKIRIRYIIISTLLLSSFFILNSNEILFKLSKNDDPSSIDVSKHISSISNISTDNSNLERLNRWNTAYLMFKEKPFFGFGPGTFAQKYSPYQQTNMKTFISTNAGNKGNAHSEYLGELAESGILGLITYVLILITVFYTGIKLYYKLMNIGSESRANIILFTLLGLFTYVVHGFLNNFLDTDKISALFWGCLAVITYLDIEYRKLEKTKKKLLFKNR